MWTNNMGFPTYNVDPLFPSRNLYPFETLYPSDGNRKGVNNGMVTFTGKKLFVQGTCQINLSDPCTGDVLYSDNLFQTGNITTTVNMNEIRGGIGNGLACILPSESSLDVDFSSARFDFWAKSAQLGATLNYGAPAPECAYATSDTGEIAVQIGVSGPPVAPLGYSTPFAYVQETGVPGTLAETGTPYPIDPLTGKISGFTAESGKTYRVIYYVNKATAQMASIGSLMDPRVVHFTAQIPVYANASCSDANESNRIGWLYVIVPRLKLSGNGGIVGDQANADTTSISGKALAYEDDVITGCGSNCGNGSTVAYYVFAPDAGADYIRGLAVVGGLVTARKNTQTQIPVRFVMENGELVVPGSYVNGFTYTATGAPAGTAVSAAGIINAGSTAGDFDIEITYDDGAGGPLTLQVAASVV